MRPNRRTSLYFARSLAAAVGCVIVALVVVAAHGAASSTIAQAPAPCDQPSGPFCDALMAPIPGWTGHVFHLSQDYPSAPSQDATPWTAFNPRTQPNEYLTAVLKYFYEGNVQPDVEASFDPSLNTVRRWYNTPWQDFGLNGREFIHGLTRERVSRAKELAPTQVHQWNNYAVGFYNAAGTVTIGRVWQNHGAPDPAAGVMPDGAVAAKLLFTTASVAEVPYLAGAPTWNAYIFADVNNPAPTPAGAKKVVPVRLLQIDIAVKDPQVADSTGWVFGTFVYGGGPGGPAGQGWTNVAPVGVMWGNDPGLPQGHPVETWLNPAVHMPHVGYQNRLNGPVDNPKSACLSCHATAEAPDGTMVPSQGADPSRWFQNIKSGVPFDAGRQSLDYSLQLTVGLANFHQAQALVNAPSPQLRESLKRKQLQQQTHPPRDGGRQ